jgi:hypothetical protein
MVFYGDVEFIYLALFLALLPGLLHRRILQVYVSKAIVFVSSWLGVKNKKN